MGSDLATLSDTVKTLEKRVQSLESLQAIHDLKYKYFDIIDHFRTGQIGNVFTRDGTASLTTMGEYKGRDAINKFFDEQFFPHFDLCLHMGHNPRITLTSETTARGTWMYEVYILTQGKAVWLTGLYKDEYVIEDGEWLISYLSGAYYFNTTGGVPWERDRFAPYPPGTPPLPEEYRILKR